GLASSGLAGAKALHVAKLFLLKLNPLRFAHPVSHLADRQPLSIGLLDDGHYPPRNRNPLDDDHHFYSSHAMGSPQRLQASRSSTRMGVPHSSQRPQTRIGWTVGFGWKSTIGSPTS